MPLTNPCLVRPIYFSIEKIFSLTTIKGSLVQKCYLFALVIQPPNPKRSGRILPSFQIIIEMFQMKEFVTFGNNVDIQ
jgi:hypothetical protein